MRFKYEKEAAKFFIDNLQQQDIEDFTAVYSLYKKDTKNEKAESMIILDNYIHTKIIEHHSNNSCHSKATIYREQNVEFFKNWVGELKRNIWLGQGNIHFMLFESIINRNQSQLIQVLDQHLQHTLDDLERIRKFLESN